MKGGRKDVKRGGRALGWDWGGGAVDISVVCR